MTQTISVAIVEDMPDTLSRFVSAIQAQPNKMNLCFTATNGQTMNDWLSVNAPDVLLVDLGLPDISGLDVIRHCRKNSPMTDIMVITLFGDERNMMGAFEAGATGYLLKDGSEAELSAHVCELHAGGSPMSPMIARQLLKRFKPSQVLEPASVPLLTPREHTMLLNLSQGFSYHELAKLANISHSTVNTHIKNIYRKLEVHSKTEAIFEARQLGLLPS
jgi:DNA-binding NarL/FixJ family response regulator